MPRRRTEYVYWDACVVESYIEMTADRWQLLRSLLRASADDSQPIRLVTSTWTITEVAYFGTLEDVAPLPEADDAIRDFWDSGALELIEYHEMIASAARDIVRRSHFEKWTVKPKDAVHIASALARGAIEFHTYDNTLARRITEKFGIPAGQPHSLRIRTGPIRAVALAEQAALSLQDAADPAADPQPDTGQAPQTTVDGLAPNSEGAWEEPDEDPITTLD